MKASGKPEQTRAEHGSQEEDTEPFVLSTGNLDATNGASTLFSPSLWLSYSTRERVVYRVYFTHSSRSVRA